MNQGTDATKNKPVIPASKIPVGDHSHLTEDEKDQVQKNIAANNINLPQGSKINVDDQGNITITYPDGSKNTISGKDTTQDVSKSDLDKAINSGNDTKNSDNYANTSNQNRDDLDKAIKHGQGVANDPHAIQKDIDNATKQINDAVDNINHGQTDAGNITSNIPGGKVTVKDPSHLTDSEKDQVKKKLEDANKDNFPAGTEITVGDDGTATVTYPDGSKDTIPGRELIIGVKGEGISGNNAEGMNGNTAKSGSKNNSLKTLPQTGNKDVTILEILGLFLSLFGLLGLKKKHREE